MLGIFAEAGILISIFLVFQLLLFLIPAALSFAVIIFLSAGIMLIGLRVYFTFS